MAKRPVPAFYKARKKAGPVQIRLHGGPLASPVVPRNDVAWAQDELRLPSWYDMVTYRLVEIDRTGVHHYEPGDAPGEYARGTPDKE